MSDDILYAVDEGIGLVTFNRPEQRNVLTAEVMSRLGEIYRQADADTAVRVVVVTGSGDAFCAGADMSQGAATFSGAEHDTDFSSCPLEFQAWQVRKPVIAACQGHAIGVGMGLALQADMRILAEEGKYGFLQTRRGVVADFACEYLLPRLVGFERAFELLVRAPRLSGREACEWGLAGRAVTAQAVLPTALEIARDMVTNCSPLVMGLHKRLLWRALDQSMAELTAQETRALHHSMNLPDAMEGGLAYFEKRAPAWQPLRDRDWPDWLGNPES